MYKRIAVLLLSLFCLTVVGFAQTCRDKNNMTIGKIESDGTVRNASNMKIGSADGVNATYAAVFYFYILFNR